MCGRVQSEHSQGGIQISDEAKEKKIFLDFYFELLVSRSPDFYFFVKNSLCFNRKMKEKLCFCLKITFTPPNNVNKSGHGTTEFGQ